MRIFHKILSNFIDDVVQATVVAIHAEDPYHAIVDVIDHDHGFVIELRHVIVDVIHDHQDVHGHADAVHHVRIEEIHVIVD